MNTNLAYANAQSQQLTPAQPAAEPQVHRQLSVNGEAVNQLIEGFKELAMRLGPVLRDVPPSGDGPTPPQEYMVPLADAFRQQTQKVQAVSEGIRSILSRLEL